MRRACGRASAQARKSVNGLWKAYARRRLAQGNREPIRAREKPHPPEKGRFEAKAKRVAKHAIRENVQAFAALVPQAEVLQPC